MQGFLPGVFGISHGALQFMAYEELKTLYNRQRNQPIDTRLVSRFPLHSGITVFRGSAKFPFAVVTGFGFLKRIKKTTDTVVLIDYYIAPGPPNSMCTCRPVIYTCNPG